MPGGHLENRLWIRQVPSFYSPAQVREYLSVVRFDPLPEESEIQEKKFERSVESLERLMRAHLTTFPWENTALHYSASHTMDVSPQGAFNRMVRDGNGSYCFGQNIVFLGILRSLGFRAYSGVARVNINWEKPEKQEVYTSHTHMLLFVQPHEGSNLTYFVDVGFGGDGLARPVPLVNGDESIVMGLGPAEENRLCKVPFPQSSLSAFACFDMSQLGILRGKLILGFSISSNIPEGQYLWTMEVREAFDGPYGPWRQMYRFSELEFFPVDCIDASLVVEQSQTGIIAEQVLCTKHYVDEQHPEHMYRIVAAGRRVTKQIPGQKEEVLRRFTSEQDRVDTLKEIFGLSFEQNATQNIKGRRPALAR
ncbi:hypothetical protein MD484_g3770, partial [Candolleomyces efflorescens]